MLFFRSETRVL